MKITIRAKNLNVLELDHFFKEITCSIVNNDGPAKCLHRVTHGNTLPNNAAAVSIRLN